jgi:uncharacterized protein (TIGR02246 family)
MDSLLRLVAEREIANLIGRYCMLFDDQDWDGMADLWTDDAAFVISGGAADDQRFEGRQAVLAFLRGCLPVGFQSKHMISPPLVEVAADGCTATARTDVVWISGNFENTIVARYHDQLACIDQRWLFHRRLEVPMQYSPGPPPMSDAATAASAATMRR